MIKNKFNKKVQILQSEKYKKVQNNIETLEDLNDWQNLPFFMNLKS